MKNKIRAVINRLGYDLYRYPQACERLIPHLQMLLPLHRIDTVIDVGANVGQFATEIRAISPSVQIHSVEPNPVVYRTLSELATKDGRWATHQCALGRASGSVTLNVFSSDDFSSCLSANEFGAEQFKDSLKLARSVEVELRTLDQLLDSLPPSSIGRRMLLKLDTQGFDLEVLHGATSTLGRVQAVLTEASLRPLYQGAPLFSEVFEFLKTAGFTLSGFFPVSRAADLSVIEADCVFVRVER